MMIQRLLLLSVCFASATSLQAVSPLEFVRPEPGIAAPEQPANVAEQERLYTDGTRAMNEQRWPDAVRTFDRVAAIRGRRSDAALYWKAYSLDKLARHEEAHSVCDQLRSDYPQSSWKRECLVLRVQDLPNLTAIQEQARMDALNSLTDRNFTLSLGGLQEPHLGDHGRAISSDPNADIKLLALNSLMQQDPAKALPLIRHVITSSDNPASVKRQAMFLLGQSKTPEAQAILAEMASGKNNPDLQVDAIRTMAISRGRQATPALVEAYRSSSDPRVKRAVISALFVAQDAPHMIELARSEKDPSLKRDLVAQIALMHDQVAADYMLELLK